MLRKWDGHLLTLIWRDLQFRRYRIVAIVLLVSIVMTLLFLMAGLVGQFNAEPALATQRAAGDRQWLLADGSSGPFTSSLTVSRDLVDQVEGAEAIITGRGIADEIPVMIIGRSPSNRTEPALTDGRYGTSDAEVVVDSSLGAKTGDTMIVNGQLTTVVGVTNDATVLAGVPMIFTSLSFVQNTLLSGEPVVSGALVDQVPATVPAGLKVMSPQQVRADTLGPLEDAIGSVNLVRALLWLITLIIIAAVIYITALERTRDFAVLKAVGGRDSMLSLSLLAQSVLMTLLATGVAAILQNFVKPLFPMSVRIPSSAWWQIPLAAVLVALIAGMAGVRKVGATSPAEAFG